MFCSRFGISALRPISTKRRIQFTFDRSHITSHGLPQNFHKAVPVRSLQTELAFDQTARPMIYTSMQSATLYIDTEMALYGTILALKL